MEVSCLAKDNCVMLSNVDLGTKGDLYVHWLTGSGKVAVRRCGRTRYVAPGHSEGRYVVDNVHGWLGAGQHGLSRRKGYDLGRLIDQVVRSGLGFEWPGGGRNVNPTPEHLPPAVCPQYRSSLRWQHLRLCNAAGGSLEPLVCYR